MARAEDLPAPPPEPSATPAAEPDALPPIEARSYDVTIQKRSSSKRTYLFENLAEVPPSEGRILLLKKNEKPIMAFRVLKRYEDRKQIVAKRVHRYGEIQVLEIGGSYNAIEKTADLKAEPLVQTAQDKADLNELEKAGGSEGLPDSPGGKAPNKADSFDPELDAASSPKPAPDPAQADALGMKTLDEGDEDESKIGISVEEVNPLDPNSQWLTAGFGYLTNYGASPAFQYYKAGGVRYGITLGQMLFLKRPHVQDSLVLEAGAYFYKAINVVGPSANDAYNVVPIIGTLRYNLLFGENFGIFIYGGLMKNFVVSSNMPDPTVLVNLASTLPAAGGGLLFRVGPGWDLRADLGFDFIGMSLLLRF